MRGARTQPSSTRPTSAHATRPHRGPTPHAHLPAVCTSTPRSQRLTARAAAQAPAADDVWEASPRVRPRSCRVYDRHRELVPYEEAWQWQKDQLSVILTDKDSTAAQHGSTDAQSTDRVVILQHPPVYTLGTGSVTDNLRFDQAAAEGRVPVVRTERGGEVTYHGPGQLVMYPLLDLTHHRQDLHWYMRGLEECVIRALWEVSGLRGTRVPGLTGVWVDGAKVAAIGIRAKRWVTYHGVALNVCPDLTPFSYIVPCGIADKPVTSVEQLLARSADHAQGSTCGPKGDVSVDAAAAALARASAPRVTPEQTELLEEYSYAMLQAFADVFTSDLIYDS